MADKKISEFPLAVQLSAGDTFPIIQSLANAQATLGQLRLFVRQPTVVSVISSAIPDGTTLIRVSGDCQLMAGTTEGLEITIVSTAAGRIFSTDLLLGGFTFAAANASLKLIWVSGSWIVLGSNGMVPGII